jgi:ABC-type transport system involved in cytochrome c biogenesis permease subunit
MSTRFARKCGVWRAACGVSAHACATARTNVSDNPQMFSSPQTPHAARRTPHLLIALLFLCGTLTAAEQPHLGKPTLVPIADTLAQVNLDGLAAVPVQHGGRYKPLFSMGMEVSDAIAYSTTLGNGHTPLTSLLDLVFCRADYDDQPIARVKHTELRRDLSLVIPEAERALLLDKGLMTPRRITDKVVRDELDKLGRLTAKTKQINQVMAAQGMLDPGNVIFQLRLFPVPAGAHDDKWRDPADLGADFATSFSSFVVAARASDGSVASFASHTWSLLPIGVETATRLGLDREDLVNLNQHLLWPLWQAAAKGALDEAGAAKPAADPTQAATLGLAEPEIVAAALRDLKARWTTLGVPDEDLADKILRPTLEAAIADAIRAWNALGLGWRAARHGTMTGAELQPRIDAFVAANAKLLELHGQDQVVRGKAPLVITSKLELTYWKWQGNIHWVWLSLLLAVPFLAMGGIGRQRWALIVGYVLLIVGFAGQMTAFVWRAELAQRIPLSNLYESMAAAALLASWIALLGEAGMSWSKRVCTLLAGIIAALLVLMLVVAFASGWAWALIIPMIGIALGSVVILLLTNGLGTAARGSLGLGAALFGCLIIFAQILLEYHDINAFISPAMPILSEFWLRVHTSCIIASYGLIALGGLMSLVYLIMRIWLPWNDPRSEAWDRTSFAIDAVAMLVLWVGLVLGAVWAAVSWGRPWGWDPKEVFALLTWVVYIGLVHLRVATPPQKRGIATAVVAIAAFVVMVFNWYWVNVQLAGLHSYA